MKKFFFPAALFTLAGLFSTGVSAEDGLASASASLLPTAGNAVQGNVLFEPLPNSRVRVIAKVDGLTPGSHGFHIHDKGDCSAPDASSAGGHFNPHQTAHGKVGAAAYHAGDLPSLEADANGKATLNVELDSITLTGEHSIVGRGLIVHADPDDYVSQPTGNAGARVACAVIQQK
ncbi:MAG: superoxide dismutase family protein [Betaproteobacteria bacterium]|nr:superoxide dismutase family protein [Betaproteobacteria bacterium]